MTGPETWGCLRRPTMARIHDETSYDAPVG